MRSEEDQWNPLTRKGFRYGRQTVVHRAAAEVREWMISNGVFGSDSPYLRRDLAVSCRERIQTSPELTDRERTAVLGGTATKLIPRLASLRSKAHHHASVRD
jgi:hypothetical protein